MHFVKAPKGKVTHIATIRVTKGLPNVLMTFCELNANGWERNRGNRPVCKFCLGDLNRLLKRLNLRVEENHESK